MSDSEPTSQDPARQSLHAQPGCLCCGRDFEFGVPPYEYQPLNPDVLEQRFLILHPCAGDKNARENHVRCSIEVRPLSAAGPFVAVRNTRGYRLIPNTIEVDGRILVVSAALQAFLRHFRRDDAPVTLWLRHVCLREFVEDEERTRYWNREFVDSMYARAAEVVDMTEFVTGLIERGVVRSVTAGRYKQWRKKWDDSKPEGSKYTLPEVIPIRLGVKPNDDNPLTTYKYVPLDMLVNEMRMIVVEPAADRNAPLVLRLAHCPIVCQVVYFALSYTWGDPEPTRQVTASGQKMTIRANLEFVLRALRSSKTMLCIWVDAVCIDQENLVERSRQIKRMFEIYHRAVQVYCYVGEPDEASEAALDLIPEFNEACMPVAARGGEEGFEDKPVIAFEGRDAPRRMAALYRFLCRPYFRRMWILQEVAVSSDPVIVLGNRRSVTFRGLESVASTLQGLIQSSPTMAQEMVDADTSLRESGVHYDELSFVRKMFYFRHLVERNAIGEGPGLASEAEDGRGPGYLELAVMARDFQASDGRDKIFALWNLVRDKQGLKFDMTYSNSVGMTFRDFAIAWAEQHGSLDVIAASEPYNNPHRFYDSSPSWCPDWSVPSTTSCFVRRVTVPIRNASRMGDLDGELYSADGGVAGLPGGERFFRFEDGVLECRGIVVDVIEAIGYKPPTKTKCSPGCTSFHPPWLTDLSNFENWRQMIPHFFEKNQGKSRYEDPMQATVAMFHGDVPSAWRRRELPVKNADDGDVESKEDVVDTKDAEEEKHKEHKKDKEDGENVEDTNDVGSEVRDEEDDEHDTADSEATPDTESERHYYYWAEWECIPQLSRHVRPVESLFDMPPHVDAVRTMVRGRTPCMTKHGYMCLAPDHVGRDKTSRKPWLIALLATCSVPVLLQEVDGPEPYTFRFGGSCFVQGCMEGELLGRQAKGNSPASFWLTEEARKCTLRIV
ncbi:hypothetical protein CPLU01_14224 [Colletotrichum plurivorum]|uniref:Heterokaryon incompatibility domain-containing protein n=1 Tax=Colletotrichum plurivorum TaxID=2175906 RepID=A0A8H6JLW9_9PEZI|nr:hypothetical protein CPLU01_14224 [Colletotrichum plurivorum]